MRDRLKGLTLAALAALVAPAAARAQVIITAGTTVTTDAPDSTHEGSLHRNTRVALSTFTAGGETYRVTGMADRVFVRRNAVSANQSHVWYATESSGGNRIGAYAPTFGEALLANDFTRGVQNLFGNGVTAGAVGNVERVDLVVTAGFAASASLAIPVFDFGAPTSHESFKIALITGIDGAGNPTAYSSLTGTPAGWGQTNLYTHSTFAIQRYNAGDTTTSRYTVFTGASQGPGGIAFRLSDFNVAAGTTVYGYSLFGYDVTDGGNPANLVNWTDAARFPTNTPDGEGQAGGFDFASVNGVFFSAVPEPASFGLAALLALAASTALRRRARV
ncbi:MAG: hypothetical protein MUE42_06185 [Opitutaceae bacterium]|jgi:hypothetical protein|nr:hypothetical protein [Opitutaceae bacterium]